MKHLFKTSLIAVLGTGMLTGCGHMMTAATTQNDIIWSGNGHGRSFRHSLFVTLKDVLDAQTDDIPTLTAIGYAVTSSQPGRSEAQKRLMAIRSARMAAMQDLAEQIHGLQVDSEHDSD